MTPPTMGPMGVDEPESGESDVTGLLVAVDDGEPSVEDGSGLLMRSAKRDLTSLDDQWISASELWDG